MILDYSNIPKTAKSLEVLNYEEITGKLCEDIDLSDENLYQEMKQLGWDMVKTCVTDQGMGLAAPQIGVYKNVFITVGFKNPWFFSFDGMFHMCINPKFTPVRGTESFRFAEGCLSVPEKTYLIERPKDIDVEYWYFDKNKKIKKNKDRLTGYSARVFLHEYDHLLGTNIVELFAKQKKIKNRKKINK